MLTVRFHPALEPLMVPKDSITPNPDNPNNGDVDEIIASILRNGCYRPIYAAEDGTILAGHHLYAALLELGCLMVPVLYVTTDAAGARRIMLADNRIAALARTDDALLLELLDIVSAEDHGLSGTGYDERYLEALRERALLDAGTPLHTDLPDTASTDLTCPACGHTWKART